MPWKQQGQLKITIVLSLSLRVGIITGLIRYSDFRSKSPVIIPILGEVELIAANGGYLTKPAFGYYSSEPPAVDFQHENILAEVEVTPKREWLVNHDE